MSAEAANRKAIEIDLMTAASSVELQFGLAHLQPPKASAGLPFEDKGGVCC